MTIPFGSWDKSALSFFFIWHYKKKFQNWILKYVVTIFYEFFDFFKQYSWIGCLKFFDEFIYWVSMVVRQLYLTSNWEARVQIPAGDFFFSFFSFLITFHFIYMLRRGITSGAKKNRTHILQYIRETVTPRVNMHFKRSKWFVKRIKMRYCTSL